MKDRTKRPPAEEVPAAPREEVQTTPDQEVGGVPAREVHSNPAPDADDHLGALETDKPGQPGQGNPNVPALDENGQPKDWRKICEDVIGANVDESEGG